MALITIKIERKASHERLDTEAAPVIARWRRRAGLVGAAVLAATALMSVAGASPSSGSDPTITALSPVKVLLSNTNIAKNAVNTKVASGGSSTVPSDATAVRLAVTVKSAQAGALLVYPYGRPAAASADSIAFPAGSVLVTTTIKTEIGQSNKISFKNTGLATASVSATITGYSLPQGGQGFLNVEVPAHTLSSFSYTTVAQLTVPAGNYLVLFSDDGYNYGANSDGIACALQGPSGSLTLPGGVTLAPNTSGTIVVQGLLTSASGGTIRVLCYDYNGTAYMNGFYGSLSATQVSAVGSGSATFNSSPRPTGKPSVVTKAGVSGLMHK